jgi:hypothetical protein
MPTCMTTGSTFLLMQLILHLSPICHSSFLSTFHSGSTEVDSRPASPGRGIVGPIVPHHRPPMATPRRGGAGLPPKNLSARNIRRWRGPRRWLRSARMQLPITRSCRHWRSDIFCGHLWASSTSSRTDFIRRIAGVMETMATFGCPSSLSKWRNSGVTYRSHPTWNPCAGHVATGRKGKRCCPS